MKKKHNDNRIRKGKKSSKTSNKTNARKDTLKKEMKKCEMALDDIMKEKKEKKV